MKNVLNIKDITKNPEDIKKDIMSFVGSQNVTKIALCVPARGMIHAGFLTNYLNFFIYFMKQPGCVPIPIFSDTMPVDKARNDIVRAGLIAKADYYFWIDSDIFMGEFEIKQMWEYLRDNPKVAAVSGIYYERESPYKPVIRKFDKAGRMAPFVTFSKENPFEIDGAGMGCFMVRGDAVQEAYIKSNGKPFEFTRLCSEDLHFCKLIKAQKNKDGSDKKIMCIPKAQAGHYGSMVREWHHVHQTAEEMFEISELHQYLASKPETKISKPELMEKLYLAAYEIHRKFEEKFPEAFSGKPITKDQEKEIDEFYASVPDYIYDLTRWWMDSKVKATEIFSRIPDGSISFLDYGCGIGDYGLTVLENYPVSHVTFYDINKPCLEYLNWRLNMRKSDMGPTNSFRVVDKQDDILKNTYMNEDGKIEVANAQYNVVFCLEVLEHLANPADHVAKIRSVLDRNGILFASVGVINPNQAAHISSINLENHGFKQISEFVFVRDDSDIAVKYLQMKV